MRDFSKYFLTLMVIGGGFYAAQPHRHPDNELPEMVPNSTTPVAEPSADRGQHIPVANRADSLPVAALADVDRLPLFDTDRTIVRSGSDPADRPSIAKQPTLRRESPAESSLAETSPPNPADEAKRPPTNREATTAEQTASKAKPEARKPTAAKPQPKKPKTEEVATPENRDDEFRPPELARQYQPNIATGRTSQPPDSANRESARQQEDAAAKTERQTAEEIDEDCDGTPSSPQPLRPDSSPDPPHVHRIAEGDTLRRLAEKYLGSRDRYLDIFHANPGVLFDPQLIPIGVEILIPERTVAMAQAAKDSPPTGTRADVQSSSEGNAAENEPLSPTGACNRPLEDPEG